MITTKAIVINTLKYGDSSLIARCYTKELGLRSYLLKGILKAKKQQLRAAYFQPLSIIEITANEKGSDALGYIKEVKVDWPYVSLFQEMDKRCISMFISEMLSNCIQQEESDPQLYNYLESALIWLDTNSEVANFHLLFLLNLSRFLGCYPDDSNAHFPYFDLSEGSFSAIAPLRHFLQDEELQLFKELLGTKFEALKNWKLSAVQRNSLLDILIQYFQLHLHGLKKPRSLGVLQELFR